MLLLTDPEDDLLLKMPDTSRYSNVSSKSGDNLSTIRKCFALKVEMKKQTKGGPFFQATYFLCFIVFRILADDRKSKKFLENKSVLNHPATFGKRRFVPTQLV